MISSSRFPIPQGTLDMLVLQILSLEPAHGYGIAQRLSSCPVRRYSPIRVLCTRLSTGSNREGG